MGGMVMMILTQTVTLEFPIETFTLPNGLKVVVVEDHSAPLVSVQVWVHAGSRNEVPGITGISHVLEHMMFKGTRKMKSEEYSLTIQRWGGMDNAFTFEEGTAYFSVLHRKYLPKILEIEYDRFSNPVFREFESEIEVVREERRWRTENSPEGSLYELVRATAYLAHPYHHPVVGWMSDLESLSREDVEGYFRTYYVANNMTLVISGDVTPEEVRPLVESTFGKLPRRKDPPPVRTREPQQEGRRHVILKREGFSRAWVGVFHIPEGKHPDLPALEVLAGVLSDGKSSRLYKRLVKEEQLALDVSAYAEQQKDPGLFVIWVTLRPDADPARVESAVFEEISRIQQEGVTDREVEKARNRVTASFIRRQQSVVSKGILVGIFDIMEGHPEAALEWPQKLYAVTQEDIQRVAQLYLQPDRMTVGELVPIPPKDMEAFRKKMQEAAQKTFRR